MPFKKHGRQYDLVVFGATGYTGRLTAEHITKHLPTDLNWAVAGRSEPKLRAVVEDCKKVDPNRSAPGIEVVNLNDEELSILVKKTFVLIATVGPYCLHGEHALRACALNGTHYLDVTGEYIWVKQMIDKYDASARASGAILIPQSGVESAPADLTTWTVARHVRRTLDSPVKDVTCSVLIENGHPSGGTLATVVSIFEQYSFSDIRAASEPYASSPVPHGQPGRPSTPWMAKMLGVQSLRNLGMVTTSIAGLTDAAQVERTWGLLSQIPTRKDEFYGPNFTWTEYWKVRNWFEGVVTHLSLIVAAFLLAFVPPFRSLVRRFVYQPGEGPSRDEAEKEFIEFRAIATPDKKSAGRTQALCRSWYLGGMYSFFLGSAAWTLLEDEDLGLEGGVLTPACLGQRFIDRANEGGFKMEVKMIDD